VKLFTLVLIFTLGACGKKAQLEFGKTRVSELRVIKGEPLKEESIPREEGKILIFEGDEKFQVEGETVTHGIRNPEGDEVLLLYWKHKFQDCETKTEKIAKASGDGWAQVQYSCPAQGLAVTYFENHDSILRVIEYAKK
jgi:hypothetical protein